MVQFYVTYVSSILCSDMNIFTVQAHFMFNPIKHTVDSDKWIINITEGKHHDCFDQLSQWLDAEPCMPPIITLCISTTLKISPTTFLGWDHGLYERDVECMIIGFCQEHEITICQRCVKLGVPKWFRGRGWCTAHIIALIPLVKTFTHTSLITV